MTAVTVADSDVAPTFYKISSSSVSNPISVQLEAQIQLSFTMPVPVESGGCYMKLEFPPEIPLQSSSYIYVGYSAF